MSKRLEDMRVNLGGIECDVMNGDNLAVTLCTHFCDGGEPDDETCWSAAAIAGCDQTLDSIHAYYAREITKLCAERDAAARDMRERCVDMVERLYGRNPKIHPVQIMRELQGIAIVATDREVQS